MTALRRKVTAARLRLRDYWNQPMTWADWLLYFSVAVLILVITWRLT
jgi:hypothetical protein